MVDTLSPESYTTGSANQQDLPMDDATMFADHKGVYKPGIERKQRKLAEKATFLKAFLEDDEKLFAITTAVSPTSFLEQWTTGLIFAYIKRCLLVFTDRRIFHIPTTMSYDYRQSVAEIRYGDLESIAQKGSRLKIAYKSGTKDLFLYVRRSERKKIRTLLQTVDLGGEPGTAGNRVHLCPKCTVELVPDRFECPGCRKEFKNRARARNLSMWMPGGGYFYTGHPFLGIMDAVVEIILLMVVIWSLIPSNVSPNGDIATAAIFAILLVLEKAVTVYHANHFVNEYIPVDGVPVRRSLMRTVLNIAGTFIILIFLAAGIFGVLIDTGQVPSDRVLSAQEIPESDYQELIAEGILENEEMIEYFYSEGLLSVTEGGSILTNMRVIAYQQNEESTIDFYYVPNDEIVSVTLVQKGDLMNYSVYEVRGRGEDNWISLWLPYEHGDGERFAEAVRTKITP